MPFPIAALGLAGLGLATGTSLLGAASEHFTGDDSPAGISPLNPTMNTLLDLLGLNMGVHGHGSDAGLPYFYDDPGGSSIFEGPYSGDDALRSALSDYMFGGPSNAQNQMVNWLLNQGGATRRFEDVDRMLGSVAGSAVEGATTGFPVDTDFLWDEASRRYRREDLPLVAEIAGANYGLGSTAFVGGAADASQRLQSSAAEAAARYQDIANARRAQMQIPAANIANAYAAFPTAYTSDIMSLENMVDARGMRPWDIFSQLAGLAGPQYQNFYQPGYNPTDNVADLIGSLGSSLPMLASSAGGLFGVGGPGSALPFIPGQGQGAGVGPSGTYWPA